MRKVTKLFRYTAIFEAAPEGGYVVRIPTLGCVTEGETFEGKTGAVLTGVT